MPKVMVSNKIAARPEMLWQAIGSFGAIANWHPMIEKSEAQGEGTGSTRTLQLVNGGKIVERLDGSSDKERRYSYSIIDGPLPVRNYTAEIKVVDNGDGTSTVEWSSDFEPSIADGSSVTRSVEDIFKSGLENLQKLYGMRR